MASKHQASQSLVPQHARYSAALDTKLLSWLMAKDKPHVDQKRKVASGHRCAGVARLLSNTHSER